MKKIVAVNTLVVKPENLEEFIETQQAYASKMTGHPNGPSATRLHKSLVGSTVVLVSQFESPSAHMNSMKSAELADHIATLRRFVESSNPIACEEVYTFGNFE